jgi:hypothetical protein
MTDPLEVVMGKYDETRARQILENAADVLAPDLEARRSAARELIKELGGLTGATRMKTLTAGDGSRAKLAIGDHAVTICFDGMSWEVHPDGGTPVTVQLGFDPHERKFVGDASEERDGLAVLLEAAMSCMKSRRQAEAVQQALGSIGSPIRH